MATSLSAGKGRSSRCRHASVRSSGSTPLFLKGILVLAALVVVAFRFKCIHARLLMPFEIDYEEGNILNTGLRIIHGQTPYPAPGSFPYILNPYGPIGYLVAAGGIKLFGIALWGPRLLVLFSGLGTALLIFLLVKIFGGTKAAAALLAVSFLCLPLVCYWLPLLRVDFFAVFLSLLGLYVFARFPGFWPISGLLFGCALLTKQTAVAAPSAVFVELLLQKKFRAASGLTGIVAGIIAVSMVILGPNFIFAYLRTHRDPYNVIHALKLGLAAAHGSLLVVAVVAHAFLFGFRWNAKSRLAWLYLGLCSISALSAGKLGSNTNHLLEWSGALCVLGGLALSDLFQKADRLAQPLSAALALLAVLFAIMAQRNFGTIAAGEDGCGQAYAFVRSFPGKRVMSDDISSIVLGGKPVLVSNPFVTTQLGSTVRWQAGTIEELAEKQYFDLILLGGPVQSFLPGSGEWSPQLITIIGQRYVPVRYFRCPYASVAYEPKSDQHQR